MYRRKSDAFIFQTPMYVDARAILIDLGIKTVLDIGCGNPQKLKAYILPFVDDITGWDLPDVVDKIDETFGNWIGVDLDNDLVHLDKIFGLIIVADVIEHLKNPIRFLDAIKRHADESTIILISTPEKTERKPDNTSHKANYTWNEMLVILDQNGFCIEGAKSYPEKFSKYRYTCNMFMCKKEKQ